MTLIEQVKQLMVDYGAEVVFDEEDCIEYYLDMSNDEIEDDEWDCTIVLNPQTGEVGASCGYDAEWTEITSREQLRMML